MTAEQALKQADHADQLRAQGQAQPLTGIPLAHKDNFCTKGVKTSAASKMLDNFIAPYNATIIDRCEQAGLVMLGKTNLDEFAMGSTNETSYYGAVKNPWNSQPSPGGASGGSAAAVAAHMTPLSIGTQTKGSIIRPASYCGVVGYKPSFGLISRNGILRQSSKLDQVGVFGKNVEDVALLTKCLIKKDLYDKDTVHYSADKMLEECRKGPHFDPKFIFYKTTNWKNIDKESQKAFEFLIKKLKKYIEVFDEPSYFKDIHKHQQVMHETDMANSFQKYYKNSKNKLGKKLIEAIERGMKYSASQYTEAKDFMEQSYRSYSEVFEDYHGVITPATTGVADKGLNFTGSPEFCTVWTYMGLPSISLPLLTGGNNLPLGVQLVGDKLDDLRFLGVANWLQKKCRDNE